MKTAVSIPDSLFKAAEEFAKRRQMPRSQLYARALELYLAETEQRNVTARLNEIYAQETSTLDPVLDTLQWVSIGRRAW